MTIEIGEVEPDWIREVDGERKIEANAEVLENFFKERVYISNPEEAPGDVEVQEGPRGGLYYELDTESEGGIETVDEHRSDFIDESPAVYSMLVNLNGKFGPRITQSFMRHAAEVLDGISPVVVQQAAQLFLSESGAPRGVPADAALDGAMMAKDVQLMCPDVVGRDTEKATRGGEWQKAPTYHKRFYKGQHALILFDKTLVRGAVQEAKEDGTVYLKHDRIGKFRVAPDDFKKIVAVQDPGRTEKGRRYVESPDEAPEGVEVHEGPQGGLWYESDDGESEASEGEWESVPEKDEIDAFETFDGKEIVVDGDVYTAGVFMALDGEVTTEEGPNIAFEDIDGMRDAPDSGEEEEEEAPDPEPEPEEELDPDDFNDPPDSLGELDDGQTLLVETDEGLETARVNWASDDMASTFLDESGEPHDILSTDQIVGVSDDANAERPTPEEASDPNDILETIPFYGDADRLESRTKDYMRNNVANVKDEERAKEILDHIEQFENMAGRGHVDFSAGTDERATLNIGSSARRNTINHEFGHMALDAFDFGIGTMAARPAMMEYDSDEDNFIQLDPDDTQYHLTYKGEGDPDPEMERLAEAVNAGWKRLQEAGEEGADDYNIKSNYSATNAHEFIAATHETLQRNFAPAEDNRNWFYNHEELLPAYVDVFEPTDANKQLISYLHENETEDSPFETNPYPDHYPDDPDSMKMQKEGEEMLEIRDYYRVWVKSPDSVPDGQNALYDASGGPAGNQYYYEVPFETTTTVEVGGDVDKELKKQMGEKARKDYPERVDLVDMGVPEKDLTLLDKAHTHIDNNLPLFGRDIKKSNPSILADVDSALTLLNLYKRLYDEGSQYSAFMNQIQKELGRRGVYSFEKVSKARRYINSPEQ